MAFSAVVLLCGVLIASVFPTKGDYNLDSVSQCSYSSSYEVHEWDDGKHVYIGRAHWSSKSLQSRCAIKLYADRDFTYESRKLKIEVLKADFDNNLLKVEIRDGSTSYSNLLVTLYQGRTYYGTFYTTQPYVYIVVDRSSCSTRSCREGLNVDLRISNHGGVSSSLDYLSTGAIIGIAIGGLVGLALLIGVPICICFCCIAAASKRQQRTNVSIATSTTASNVNPALAYPRQQYIVEGGNVTPFQPQPQYNLQAYQANAPPSYPMANQYPQEQVGQHPYPDQQQQQHEYPQQLSAQDQHSTKM